MSHPVYSCRLRFQRIHHVCLTLELHTPRQIPCKHLHANSETIVDIICFGLLYICMSSRVPKGIVFHIVDCSNLINFVFSSDKLDPRRSAGLVFWRGKSSFVVDWTRVHLIPILLAVHTPSRHRSFSNGEFVHETLISRV